MVERLFGLLYEFIKHLLRKKVSVSFNNLHTIKPVSPIFGVDRGTPVARYYIEKFLQRNSALIGGRILEVGDSYYSKRFSGKKAESFEVLHVVPGNKAATIVGDLTDPTTLPENSMDCFICTQTLQFIYPTDQAVRSAHRLLKPGGVLLATVPSVSRVDRHAGLDGDFWRFTGASCQRLFDGVFGDGNVAVSVYGNVLAAIGFLTGLAREDLTDPELDEQDPYFPVIVGVRATKA